MPNVRTVLPSGRKQTPATEQGLAAADRVSLPLARSKKRITPPSFMSASSLPSGLTAAVLPISEMSVQARPGLPVVTSQLRTTEGASPGRAEYHGARVAITIRLSGVNTSDRGVKASGKFRVRTSVPLTTSQVRRKRS